MKFGEFFKKYTLCSLIYTAISIVLSILTFFGVGLYVSMKKETDKEKETMQSLYDELQSINSDEE